MDKTLNPILCLGLLEGTQIQIFYGPQSFSIFKSYVMRGQYLFKSLLEVDFLVTQTWPFLTDFRFSLSLASYVQQSQSKT